MQGIEGAIRNALTKSDSADPVMRQQIYESVWSAHERAMAANANLSDQQRTERRDKLKFAISQVEQEIRGNVSRPADVVDEEPANSPATEYDGGLGVPELDRGAAYAQPSALRSRKGGSAPEVDLGYEPSLSHPAKAKKHRKSRLFSLGLPLACLLAAGFIGWSLYNSLVAMRPMSGAALSENGSLAPLSEKDNAERKDWVTIFTASQPDRISVQGKATAEIVGSDTARYARITSPRITDTVSFDVGPGILTQLEGKQATFEVAVRSDDAEQVQVSVNCDFGALGVCGRKRYEVSEQQSSLLFDVNFVDGVTANSTGQIIFSSDMNGKGKSIDIYRISVKIPE